MAFPGIDPGRALSTEDGRPARVRWSVQNVLQRASLNIDDAVRDGALLSVVLQWDCPNVDRNSASCTPRLQVVNLAKTPGFSVTWATYHRVGSPAVLRRDLHQAVGLRLVVTSRGRGAKRRHYREYKTEVTPDFSDVRAKVVQLEKQSKTQRARAAAASYA